MKKTVYTVLFTSIISVLSLQAQDTPEEVITTDDYYNHTSFATSMEQHIELLTELDSIRKNIDDKVAVSIEDATILRRMKAVTKTIPLDYNSQVKYYIDKYVSENYKPYMSRLYGLSKYYFKVYDKIMAETGVPEEVRYLSLIESSLNPHLVSSSGAVGPWQFMYTTAKIYDLDMNSTIDERKDIYAATYAVTKYLKEAHDQFNDWLLALASYNCGKGCVQRAISRSGLNNPSFWELSPFLPKETQNYIPKYVAMTYVMYNADLYGIQDVPTELDYETKVVMVDKTVDMRHLAKAVNMDLDKFKNFNPAFKKTIINGTVEKPKRIFIPLTGQQNDSLLYVALNAPSTLEFNANDDLERLTAGNSVTYHKVKRGETLASISSRYGVTLQDLKAWNGLKNNSLLMGRSLRVSGTGNSNLARNIAKAESKNSETRTAYYIVKKGDSLDRISRKFSGSSVSKIKTDNNLRNSMIKPGMRLKITKG